LWHGPAGCLSQQSQCAFSSKNLYKAVQQFFQSSNTQLETVERSKQEKKFIEVIASIVPAPVTRPFWVLGLDVTPIPCPYAQTLAARTFIYQLNPIKGNGYQLNTGHFAASGF